VQANSRTRVRRELFGKQGWWSEEIVEDLE
jgi:hypothetical protein